MIFFKSRLNSKVEDSKSREANNLFLVATFLKWHDV
jgi:hypothetical protein